MVRVDLTARIQNAGSIAECDELAQEILADRPDQVVLLFAQLYQRRSVLAGEAGKEAEAELDGWVATLLRIAFRGTVGHEMRVIPDAGDAAMDSLAPWRTADSTVFEHYWQLAQGDDTPEAIRAVALQGLWELRPLWQTHQGDEFPRPIDIVPRSVDAHVDAAKWIAGEDMDPATRGMLAARHWVTASQLAASVGHPEWVNQRVADLHEMQTSLLQNAPHWAFSLVRVEADLAVSRGRRRQDLVSDERLEELLPVLDEIDAALQTMGGMGHVQEEVLEARAQVENCLGRNPDQRERARRRAELHQQHARASTSGIVASMRWKASAAEFQQAGLRDDANRAKAEARDALRRAEAEGEFQGVEVPIEIDREHHERILSPFFEGATGAETVLRRMACRFFVPSLEQGRPASRGTGSIVGQIAVTVPMVDDRSLAEIAPGTEEQQRYEERRALLQEVVFMSGVVISELFEKVRGDFQLHEEELVAHLAASPFVEPDDLPFLRATAARYLRGDCISAMHVLVPRVEQLIRRILKTAGTEITALRDGELRERALGELLRAGEADGTLPTPLARLLQAVLSEEWGLNLRNRVAHGLLAPGDCSQANVDRVLHTALLLAGIRLEEQAQPDRPPVGSGAPGQED